MHSHPAPSCTNTPNNKLTDSASPSRVSSISSINMTLNPSHLRCVSQLNEPLTLDDLLILAGFIHYWILNRRRSGAAATSWLACFASEDVCFESVLRFYLVCRGVQTFARFLSCSLVRDPNHLQLVMHSF